MKLWPPTLFELIQHAIPDATTHNDDDVFESRAARRGWGIEGDGFYVWDDDRRQAEEWAIELAGPAYPHEP